jgi:hypothetical protein
MVCLWFGLLAVTGRETIQSNVVFKFVPHLDECSLSVTAYFEFQLWGTSLSICWLKLAIRGAEPLCIGADTVDRDFWPKGPGLKAICPWLIVQNALTELAPSLEQHWHKQRLCEISCSILEWKIVLGSVPQTTLLFSPKVVTWCRAVCFNHSLFPAFNTKPLTWPDLNFCSQYSHWQSKKLMMMCRTSLHPPNFSVPTHFSTL